MDDEIIKKNLIDELYWDARIDASNIKAEVDNGKVKIEGTVPTYGSKLAADMDAWNIDGVRTVINDLNVRYKTELPSDDDIQRIVHNNMVWNPYLSSYKIDVEVNGGVVTLNGTVDAYWKKITAETEAEDVMGVIEVVNNMGVVPSGDFVDEDIARDITDTLSRKVAVPEENVNVMVKDGRVTLTGKVPNWHASNIARRAAERTLGVIDVVNELRIEP